jgi:hypothetical protein
VLKEIKNVNWPLRTVINYINFRAFCLYLKIKLSSNEQYYNQNSTVQQLLDIHAFEFDKILIVLVICEHLTRRSK